MSGLKEAVVRILDQDEYLVGAGVLLADRRIVTTAQVVNMALKIDPWVGMPSGLVAGSSKFQPFIQIEFPYLVEGFLLKARTHRYYPALYDNSGDLAELELLDELPKKPSPVKMVASDRLFNHRISVVGFRPRSHYILNGELLGIDRSGWIRYHLETSQSYRAEGLRGAPIWDEQLKGMVGLITEVGISPAGFAYKDGLAIGASLICKAFPQLARVEIYDQDLCRQGCERAAVLLSGKEKHHLENEKNFITRKVAELEAKLGNEAKGKLRVYSVLLGQADHHYRLVVDMPEAVFAQLDQTFHTQGEHLKRMGILDVRPLFGDTRAKENFGPKAFSDQLGRNSVAENVDQELDESLQRLAHSLNERKAEMEMVMQRFIDAAGVALRQWDWDTAERIVKDEYEHTRQIGSSNVNKLRGEVRHECDQVHTEVNQHLNKDELWWHKKPAQQRYVLWDSSGRLRGAGEIETSLRKISERLKTVLMRYGYQAEKYWNYYPFEWSPVMKDEYRQYEELRQQAAEVYLEYNKLKETQRKNSGKGNAAKLWEN